MCDLLGFERFDLIAEMLQNREQILKEEELALAQKRLEEIGNSCFFLVQLVINQKISG